MDGNAVLKLRSPKTDNIQNLYHESYDLIHCEYSLKKSTDKEGRVNGDVIAGAITVALPMLPNDTVMSWVLDISKKYNGEITINDAFSESLERIYFEEGRPVGFRLHYEPGEATNVVLVLTINAQKIVIGENEYINRGR
jgi:hypothetical protein